MALYLEPPKPKVRVKRPKNPTLENVAEEMINGLFCTYEEPNPVLRQAETMDSTSTKSILMPSKLHRSASIRSTKSVHWADTLEEDEDDINLETKKKTKKSSSKGRYLMPSSPSCSPRCAEEDDDDDSEDERDYFGIYNEELQTVDSSDCGAPSRESNLHNDLIFDDDGNIADNHQQTIPPPPPPPPSRRERFVPELCGVGIHCTEDESQLSELSAANQRHRGELLRDDESQHVKVYHRPLTSESSDDSDDILADSSQEEDREPPPRRRLNQKKQRAVAKLKKRRASGVKQISSPPLTKQLLDKRETENEAPTPTTKNGKDWENVSNASTFFGLRKSNVNRDDPVERQRARHASKNTEESQRSKNNKTVSGPVDLDDAGDWDESTPIVNVAPVKASQDSSNNGKKSRWSLGGSSKALKENPDGTTNQGEKKVVRNSVERKASRERSKRDPSPGPVRRRSRSKEGKSPRSLFNLRGRSKSPGKKKKNGLNPTDEVLQERLERESMIGAHRASFDPETAPPPPPPPPPLGSGKSINPYDHPAHPWNNNCQPACCDDVMERMSFITAHRRGFEEEGPMKEIAEEGTSTTTLPANETDASEKPESDQEKQSPLESIDNGDLEKQAGCFAGGLAMTADTNNCSACQFCQRKLEEPESDQLETDKQDKALEIPQTEDPLLADKEQTLTAPVMTRAEKRAAKKERKAAQKLEKEKKKAAAKEERQKRKVEKNAKKAEKARRDSDLSGYFVPVGPGGTPILLQSSSSMDQSSLSPNPSFQIGPGVPVMALNGMGGKQPMYLVPQVSAEEYHRVLNVQRSSASSMHELQQQRQSSLPIQESETGETLESQNGQESDKDPAELTWEERTRQAWERLRGTFGLEALDGSQNEEVSPATETTTNSNDADSASKVSSEQSQLRGILKAPSYERRVRFGKDTEKVFTNDENYIVSPQPGSSNRSMAVDPSIMTSPASPPMQVSPSAMGTNATLIQPASPLRNAVYVGQSPTKKKKKVLRASKILKELVHKKKREGKTVAAGGHLMMVPSHSSDVTFPASQSVSGDEQENQLQVPISPSLHAA